MFCKRLCIFLLGFNVVAAGVYPYRDITNPPFPLHKNIRILQCSPPRTGSTLIHNVLQYLFEDVDVDYSYVNFDKKVIKIHRISDIKEIRDTDLIISTIRNPLDAFASKLIHRFPVDENKKAIIIKENLEGLVDHTVGYYNEYHSFIQSIPKNKLLVLLYEQFNDNFDFIFSELEAFFHISIDEKMRQEIEGHFNKNAMKLLSMNYDTCNDYHPIIGIHGKHINNSDWKQNIPEEHHDYLLNKFHDVLVRFGYPTAAG